MPQPKVKINPYFITGKNQTNWSRSDHIMQSFMVPIERKPSLRRMMMADKWKIPGDERVKKSVWHIITKMNNALFAL